VSETWTLSELVDEAAQRLEALPPPKNGQVRAVPDERTIRYYGTIGLLDRPAAMRGRTALYSRKHLAQVVAIKRMQSAGHSLADIQAMWSTLDDATLGRMSGVQVVAGKAKAARKDFWKREAEASAEPTRYAAPTPDPSQAHRTGPTTESAQPNRTGPLSQAHRTGPTTESAQPHRTGPLPTARALPPRTGPIVPTTIPAPSIPAPPTGPTIPLPPGVPMTPMPGDMPSGNAPQMLPLPTFTPYVAPAANASTISVPLESGVSIVITVAEDAAVSLSPADVRALRAAAAPLVTELAKRGLIASPRGGGTLEEGP